MDTLTLIKRLNELWEDGYAYGSNGSADATSNKDQLIGKLINDVHSQQDRVFSQATEHHRYDAGLSN